ncbi:MAG: GNAT family N-acetyltransferase [Dehalococcoidia bacterium]
MNSVLRELGHGDLVEVDALRASIGWGAGSWFLEPLLDSGGTVLGRRDVGGAIDAMGATARFGNAGFICNMVVRSELKRQGAGTVVFGGLLDWLATQGIRQVQLEATEEGKGLYEKFGFRARWDSVLGHASQPVEPGDGRGIADVAGEEEWRALLALDRRATGSDRGAFLRALFRSPHEKRVLRLLEGDRLIGFGFRWEGRIGPLIAETPEAAEKLARALASCREGVVIASIGHPMHAAMWEGLGFVIEPLDVRMVLGPAMADEPGMVVAMLNGAVG